MAYAGYCGVPPMIGVYTIVPALLAYALLGYVAQLVVGPDTATGSDPALTVGAIAALVLRRDTLTSTLAVMIGIFFLSFGVVRMGWVARFVPASVMRGFVEGLVYVTIIGQVPHLLGIGGASAIFSQSSGMSVQHLPDVWLAPVLTGISSSQRCCCSLSSAGIPATLIVLAGRTILIGLLAGEATGCTWRAIPSGLPDSHSRPRCHHRVWLAPGALAIVRSDMPRHSARRRRPLFRAVAT